MVLTLLCDFFCIIESDFPGCFPIGIVHDLKYITV